MSGCPVLGFVKCRKKGEFDGARVWGEREGICDQKHREGLVVSEYAWHVETRLCRLKRNEVCSLNTPPHYPRTFRWGKAGTGWWERRGW